jgi:SAM-dependent methyltransferase
VIEPFVPEVCDLCGSTAATVLAHLRTGRSLRSDRRLLAGDLRKLCCRRCGLVRQGDAYPEGGLAEMYAAEYAVAPADYTFYTSRGPVTRTSLFRAWLVEAFGTHHWRGVRRCLEIGAGAGALLHEFQTSFPDARFEGIELCAAAVAQARQHGRAVRQAVIGDTEEGVFDAVYTIAVLEHVPSPTRFLRDLRRCLRPGGLLYLAQPTQDVPSYDIFFVDHLHHFGTDHLRSYARKCGFREIGMVVGHEWMPNFSLHLWQVAPSDTGGDWAGPPGYTTCADTVRQVSEDLRCLDRALSRLAREGRRVGVFGLNEVYALARAYSDLGVYPLSCGLADRPDNPDYAHLGFPVVPPEKCRPLGVADVVLAVNKVYYPQVRQRLGALGVTVYPVLN